MNPIVTLHTANDRKIVIELLPESASNTVNNFVYTASRGYLDHHAIGRIVPGNWAGVSYTTFGEKECRYLIPNGFELNPDVEPPGSHPESVCMGGCGKAGLAGCEFFFPLRDCPDHKGIYPTFSRVLEGMDKVYRLEEIETVSMTDFPTEGVEVNRPMRPEIIERMELEFYGVAYPEPVKVREPELPEYWKDETAK